MSEATAPTAGADAARPTTAGGLLRQARLAQGLHIAALAAAIKVVPRKLELLESDQFDQLPDATFTRALAQTVCRTLKIDPAPILALLPPPRGHRLEQVAVGLNTPFHDRPGNLAPKEWAHVANPVLWILGVIAAMTLAVYAAPASWLSLSNGAVTRPRPADKVEAVVATPAPMATVDTPSAASAASQPDAVAGAVASSAAAPATPEAAEQVAVAPAAPDAVVVAAASGVLQFRATAQTWVDVTDARGQSLIARLLQPGENVGLDGTLPMKVTVGNVAGTQVVFRGQPYELVRTRDNVARFELK
ncbi:MAG: helix-turn-helix domain-containing protein [Pseudomonadota bacterium]